MTDAERLDVDNLKQQIAMLREGPIRNESWALMADEMERWRQQCGAFMNDEAARLRGRLLRQRRELRRLSKLVSLLKAVRS
jgi:hypothetical protein